MARALLVGSDMLHRSTHLVACAFVFVSVAFAVACTAPATGPRPLPVCDEGTEGCGQNARASKKPASPAASGETTLNDPVTAPQPSADAGSASRDAAPDAAPDAGLGVSCDQLSFCCDELAASGQDDQACRVAVGVANEPLCYSELDKLVSKGVC